MLFVRRAASVALACVLALLTLAAVAWAGMASVGRDDLRPATADGDGLSPPASSSPAARFTVAVVVGVNGTVGSDVLAPYEVFARSADFSVFTVAASAAPVPLEGGPTLVPAHTFAEVDAGLVRRPDVVVVPALADPTGAEEAPLRNWVVSQSRGGAEVLGVCNGAQVLAATGLLDGHRATSHWSTLSALRKTRPAVHWVRGQRYVQDGSITTTAGVTSGIPGALAVIDQLAGPAEAARVGRAVQYPGWSLDGSAAIPDQHFGLSDLPVGLDHVLPWGRPVVGVGLADGGGEIDLTAAFEVYSMSAAAHTVPLAAGPTVTTRHGVVLLTTSLATAPAVDRLIVPSAPSVTAVDPRLRTWAAGRHLAVEPLHGAAGELGFDAALQDLAAHAGRGSALSAAKMIDYPATQLPATSAGRPWRAPALLGLSVLLAAGVGLLPTALRRAVRHHRARRRPSDSARDLAAGRLAGTAPTAAADPS
jgi:putative intracellular protease/amidase